MMQAIRFEKTGGAEALVWQQISVDKPGPGQVQLKLTDRAGFDEAFARAITIPGPNVIEAILTTSARR